MTAVLDGRARVTPPPAHSGRPLARIEWGWVAAIAAVKAGFHLATATLYGFHRDEFYYLACGRHLAAGYVDHPPITPLMYRGWSAIFGASERSLHSFAAVLSIPMVILAALLARELGGGRWSQRTTMIVAAVGTVFTTTFHFVGTVTFDLLLWALATWLVIRLLRTEDVRLWLAVGAAAGIAFENKHSALVWCAAMAIGFLVTPQRKLLRTPWLLAGAAVFVTIAAPNIAWEATHDWASLAFYRTLRHDHAVENLVTFWPLQFGLMTIGAVAIVIAGLRWLRTSEDGRRYAPLAVAFVTVVVAFFLAAGKGYYTAGIFLPVVAAGAVAVERDADAARRRRLVAAVLVTGLLAAPVFTPVLPASAAVDLGLTKINSDLGAMQGWHDIVDQLATVYRGLPPGDRASAVFLTRDYSEAESLTYWARDEKLPPAISGHNNVWWWGFRPAEHATVVIGVGLPADYLQRFFTSVTPAGTLHGQIDPTQDGLPISICRGPRQSWSQMWPDLRAYG